MFPKFPILLATASSFIAVDGGGAALEDDVYLSPKARLALEQSAAPVLLPMLAAGATVEAGADAGDASAMRQTAAWEPASAARSRHAEGAVTIALCAYFVSAAASLLHWI